MLAVVEGGVKDPKSRNMDNFYKQKNIREQLFSRAAIKKYSSADILMLALRE
jgi:hypothetical protein